MQLKEYLTQRGYFTNLPTKVPCAYSPSKCEYCREENLFESLVCDRLVPWCVGGAGDGGDDMCSDCWYQATQLDWIEENE